MRIPLFRFLFALFASFMALGAAAAPGAAQERKLANGLRVIVKEEKPKVRRLIVGPENELTIDDMRKIHDRGLNKRARI